MKKLISILFLALASSATAGEPYSYSAKLPVPAPSWEESVRVSPFVSYEHKLGGGASQADNWGAGISIYKPLGDSRLGIEGAYTYMAGNVSDIHEGGASLRFDMFDLGALTVYSIASVGYQFTGSEDGWRYGGGLGLNILLSERVNLFADWRYLVHDRSALSDTGSARLGLGYSF